MLGKSLRQLQQLECHGFFVFRLTCGSLVLFSSSNESTLRHLSLDFSGTKRLFYIIELGRSIRCLRLLQESLGPKLQLTNSYQNFWHLLANGTLTTCNIYQPLLLREIRCIVPTDQQSTFHTGFTVPQVPFRPFLVCQPLRHLPSGQQRPHPDRSRTIPRGGAQWCFLLDFGQVWSPHQPGSLAMD